MNKQGSEERYRRIIEKIDRLPSLPAVAARLIDIVNSPDSSADDAAVLIEKDPALTTKLLRLANSAFYGMPRSISSVSSAVVILGFNTIRSVALSASIMKMFGASAAGSAFDHVRFWRHSIITAMTGRAVSRRLFNFIMIDPEAAFCAGILHDIGRLIFSQFAPEECALACAYARQHAVPLIEGEKQTIGITHARIGSILADKWALPPELECAIVYHHEPAKSPKGKELVSIVNLSDSVCHAIDVSLWEGEVAPPLSAETRDSLKISAGDFDDLCREARESIERSDEFFAIVG